MKYLDAFAILGLAITISNTTPAKAERREVTRRPTTNPSPPTPTPAPAPSPPPANADPANANELDRLFED